ncbi:MAG TPA: class I SAM-dependent methyltransferase [Rhodanobacteraceae bacterium]
MPLAAIGKLIRAHQLVPALRAKALYKPFYTLTWIAGAKHGGLLDLLHDTPQSFEQLASRYGTDAKSREALGAWLLMGVHLKLLRLRNDGYRLRGLMRTLARSENDATLALAQEAATLHHKLIHDTPEQLAHGKLWQLADQDGELTARSSLALEVFQKVVIDRFFPATGALQLLEIGCGAAVYIRHAATRHAALHALGLELQANVADIARANIRQWGLSDRVTIEVGDIRKRPATSAFDIVTLYNNIYYFPVAERVALLGHIKGFIKPGGFVLLTTCCQGGSLGMDALNLWGATTAGGGRLPEVAEMHDQLVAAGFTDIAHQSLVPGDSYHAFRARRPSM